MCWLLFIYSLFRFLVEVPICDFKYFHKRSALSRTSKKEKKKSEKLRINFQFELMEDFQWVMKGRESSNFDLL